MPIKVIKNLPAITKLAQENIFVMDTERAENQQIRPLHDYYRCSCRINAF